MTSFLYKIAEVFYTQYGNELYRHTFVFPNRRAGFFFQKYLAEIAGKPLFSPFVTTIQELFASLSSYRPADKIEMLVVLYNHFGRISGSDESFDDFLYWGEMLLDDFNDVDKYMADAGQLFRNVHDFRSMDDDLTHLTEKQREAIRRFWTNFMPVGESATKKKFQETWQILYELYSSFRAGLHEKGLAYEGMMFREVAERAVASEPDPQGNPLGRKGEDHPDHWPFQSYIFVGLNALTPAETMLLDYLKNLGMADFYWDYESPLLRDPQNRASLWVKENLRRFPSKFDLRDRNDDGAVYPIGPAGGKFPENSEGESGESPFDETEIRSDEGGIRFDETKKDDLRKDGRGGAGIPGKTGIEVIGIPSGVGQAKHVTQLLSRLVAAGAIPDPDEAINTAIVLPDERLLLPVLYSIPPEIGKINVTMGYGLSYSSISALMEHIAGLQRNMRESAGERMFYHRNVLSILNHPFVYVPARDEAEAVKAYILTYNRIVVSESEFPPHPLFRLIFRPITNWRDIFDYLKSILSYIYGSLSEEKQSRQEPGSSNVHHEPMDDSSQQDPGDNSMRPAALEREFIVQYHKTVTRLQDRLYDVGNLSMETCFRLLKKLTHSISVAFSGEPLSGLQVMGVLETRVIDFENLIILSMNEGVFPLKDPVNSFIPFTLRKGFGLPVYEHRDSMYAYHFYRMISRAKRVFMLYDTRTEEMQTGEVSRYFYQLKYLYADHFDLSQRVVAYDVAAPQIAPVSVAKTAKVLRKLDAFRQDGGLSLSASLINNYINCPLQFYFTAVEGLREEDEVRESVEFDLFGSIFHKLMETIYSRYKDKTVTPDVLTAIAGDDVLLTRLIEEAFAEYYFKQADGPRSLEGQHYLVGEILRSYVKQTLETDKQFTPFEFVGAEYRFGAPYRVNDELSVHFKGIIDRIDRVGDGYRIIDYKTGTGITDFKQIPDLFDGSKANRPYQILQVFVYALFYAGEHPEARLSPAIYYLRSIYGDLSPAVTCNKRAIPDIAPFMEEFRSLFNDCLAEIFDPAIPFTQTKNTQTCQWCSFKDLCNR